MDGQTLGIVIPVAAIAGWYIHGIFSEKFQAQREVALSHSDKLKEILASHSASQQIQASLESIEKRLTSIQKVLEEIPS